MPPHIPSHHQTPKELACFHRTFAVMPGMAHGRAAHNTYLVPNTPQPPSDIEQIAQQLEAERLSRQQLLDQHTTLQADRDRLAQLVAADECIICCTESKDMVFVPCGHLCLCHVCADVIVADTNRCPTC